MWWFPCQKHHMYTVFIWFWPTLHINISPVFCQVTWQVIIWTPGGLWLSITDARGPSSFFFSVTTLKECTHLMPWTKYKSSSSLRLAERVGFHDQWPHNHLSCSLSSDLTGDHLNPRRVVALEHRCTWALLFLLFRNNKRSQHFVWESVVGPSSLDQRHVGLVIITFLLI
jgi:hypothetical protein